MKFVDEADWPTSRRARGSAVHASMFKHIAAILAGAALRLNQADMELAGYKTLHLMGQRLRAMAQDHGVGLTILERVVIKDSNLVVKEEDLDGFQPDELEDVIYVRRRD